ncbi:MAG TPA: methionine--tRNA ligase [Acidimicrobiales bacterium]|nr:methionine--tRNA ligase [Acidimicrobiales bacterium]
MAERYFQTTPIFYVNDRPHLGTAYTVVVADALARWHRLIGDDVFFLTGTDEYGLKVARAAAERGLSPKAWVDEASEWFRKAWAELGITNDAFIRTTDPEHEVAVREFIQTVHDNGHIYKGEYAGWYCVSCENYYTDEELLEGQRCPIHERAVEWLTEENYFFRLSSFTDALLEWYAAHPQAVLPASRRNEALGLIRQGLEDISITRTNFDWGVRVPFDEQHVVYVWFDALVNYMTAVGYGVDPARFASWWPAVHHLVGKDIVKFHCVWWPAMCMAAGLEPPHTVVAHGWLLVGGTKMSKSRANQIDPVELAGEVGLDPLRYHLLRDVTLGADGDFTYEGLIGRYNADLANNLGNLLARVSTVVTSKCEGVAPPPSAEARLAGVAAEVIAAARDAWARSAPHEALEATWQLIRETNAELEAREPWKLPPGDEVAAVLGDALEALRLTALLAYPAIPDSALEIWRRLGFSGSPADHGAGEPTSGVLAWGLGEGGQVVEKGDPLFPRRQL